MKIVLPLVFCFISACTSNTKNLKSCPILPSQFIALLPFENQSNDLEASQKVREVLFKEMQAKGFQLIELEKIDFSLQQLGIIDGGQLGAISLEKIQEIIPVDLFCYGSVIEFGLKSAVAFSQRKVEINLKLIESKTGKVLFEGTETGITSRAGTDAAGDLVVHTAGKVFKSVKEGTKKLLPGKTLKKTADLTDEVADVDLIYETQQAIQKLLNHISIR